MTSPILTIYESRARRIDFWMPVLIFGRVDCGVLIVSNKSFTHIDFPSIYLTKTDPTGQVSSEPKPDHIGSDGTKSSNAISGADGSQPQKGNDWRRPWRHMLVILNAVAAHTVGALGILLLIKILESCYRAIYGVEGLTFLQGTQYHLTARIVFDIFDLWVLAIYTAAAVLEGLRRWLF